MHEKAEKRKAAGRKAAETKRKKIIEHVNSLDIQIPEMSLEDLKSEAIYHFNDFEDYKERNYNNYHPRYIKTDSISLRFLKRIEVNYIRHQLTDYEVNLEELFGKTGKKEAYKLLKNRILDAIATQYPELADGCENQKIK